MFGPGVRENYRSNEIVTVTTNGTLTIGKPCLIYLSTTGALMGINSAVAANTPGEIWGVPVETVTTGLPCKVQIGGVCTILSGGTPGNLVTSITKDGVVTDATPADGVLALGTSLSATTFIKYKM